MSPSLRRLVGIAAAVSLLVTAVRLGGELAGWPEPWFSREPGGGGAVVGIGWIAPVVGALAALQLAREGRLPRRPWAAVGRTLLGYAATACCFTVVFVWLGTTIPGMVVGMVGALCGGGVAFAAWPALGRTLLAYALLARVPVVALTIVDVASGLGTHYGKLAQGAAPLEPLPRTVVLCLAQLLFWVPFTLLFGILCGALLVAVRPGRRRLASGGRAAEVA